MKPCTRKERNQNSSKNETHTPKKKNWNSLQLPQQKMKHIHQIGKIKHIKIQVHNFHRMNTCALVRAHIVSHLFFETRTHIVDQKKKHELTRKLYLNEMQVRCFEMKLILQNTNVKRKRKHTNSKKIVGKNATHANMKRKHTN